MPQNLYSPESRRGGGFWFLQYRDFPGCSAPECADLRRRIAAGYAGSGHCCRHYRRSAQNPDKSGCKWNPGTRLKTFLHCIPVSQFQKYWLSRVNHLFFRASKPFRRTNPDFFTKNGKKSNFGPFSSSPVNAGCSRYPFVYVSLISSIQAC